MNDGCGCGAASTTPKKYIMVEASGNTANPCGDPVAAANDVTQCPRQEPDYDFGLSGFILPEHGFSVGLSVCNPENYIEGLYIEFVAYGIVMLIDSVDVVNKQLSIKNACRNGNPIGNPDAGVAVGRNAVFVVVGEPNCISDEEGNSAIIAALSTLTELCVPDLETSNSTAVHTMVGFVESDPGDTEQGKCIQKINGFGFRDGGPVTPGLQLVAEADNFLYKEVVKNASGQHKYRKTPGEHAGTVANAKYVMAGTKASYKPVGPAYVFSPFEKTFGTSGTLDDKDTYTALADGDTHSQNFSVAIAEITSLLNKDLQDHFYIIVQAIVGMYGTSTSGVRYLKVEFNNKVVGYVGGVQSGVNNIITCCIPVKVMNVDTNWNFKLTAQGGGIKFAYDVKGLGAYI